MKSGTIAKLSTCQLAIRKLAATVLKGGLLARASFFVLLFGLAIISFYSRSSASAPSHTNVRQVDARRFGGVNQTDFNARLAAQGLSAKSSAFVNRSFLSPLPPPSPATIETFASDCTTPKTDFSVGDTICAKVSGIQVSPFFPRRLTWAAPDSTVVQSTDIATDPQSSSLLIAATSVVNGRTIDNRGTWQLLVRNPFFFFPEAIATFTISDPQNRTADLGVAVTAASASIAAGAQAVFQLQVNNYGPDTSTNVQLTDAVPANTTFVSFQQLNGPVFTCSSPSAGSTGTTTCSISTLEWPDNSVATFIATYQVDNGVATGTVISNAAAISSVATQTPATADQNDKDDSSSADETVAASPCVISCPSNIDVNADSGQAGAVVTYSAPSSTGDCGQPVTGEGGEVTPAITCSPASGSFFPAGTTTVVCSGQTNGVCTFQVTVENPGALSITLSGANPLAVECGADFNDPGASAVNGTGQSVPVIITVPQGFDPGAPAQGSYVITYTATDGPNSVSTTRTVNVSDNTAPAITVQGANPYRIIQGSCSPFVDPGVSADDGCAGPETVTSALGLVVNPGPPPQTTPAASVDTSTAGTYIITYTATDGTHQATATRTVIVGQFSQDESDQPASPNVPPTITLNCPLGVADCSQTTIECGDTVTDLGATAAVCGGTVQVTTTGTVDRHTPGTYTINYSATANNLTSTATRTVTVQDTTAPTITVNGANPLTVECHGSFTDPGATAHDGCAGDFAATASGSVDANTVGTYTITYNASDPTGNSAAAVTRTVNVVDSTAPTVTAPADVTVNTGAGATSCGATVSNAQLGTGTANDACQGAVSVSRSGVPAGNVFPVGTTNVTYSATDSHSNTGSAVQHVTVVDNTPPVVTAPAAVTLFTGPGATLCGFTVSNLNTTLGTGSATDNCSGVGAVTRSGVPAGNVFPVGQTTVTYSATDAHGNTASATQVVTVVDNTPPTISCVADIIADFNPAVNGAVVTYTAPAGSDNCAGATTAQIAGLASGATFPLGTTTNTFRVTDAVGLTATCSFKVTVALTSIIGLDSVSITGSGQADSYDSTGGYPATKSSLANILSNGTITLGGSGKVWGNVRSTRAGIAMSGASQVTGNATAGTTVTKTGSATVGGTTTNNALAPVMTLPSVAACSPYSSNSGISGTYSYSSSTGDLSLSGVNIATLANGSYCFHNVTLTNSAQLKVNGLVVIKMTGTLNTSGATSLTNTTSIPGNLRILSSYSGSNGVTFGNSTNVYLVIYAPTTGMSISGAAPLFGTVAAKTITISNSGMIHYDTQLKNIWPAIWLVLP